MSTPRAKASCSGLAHDAADGLAMQLRRGVLQLADRARVKHDLFAMPACTWKHFLNLERVRVDQADQGRGGDEHIALIQVADHVAARMQSAERGRQVAGGAVQVAPVETRQGRLAAARVEDVQHGNGGVDMRHHVPGQPVFRIVQQAGGPGQRGVGDRASGILGRVVDHPGQLFGVIRARTLLVDLCQPARLAAHAVNSGLPTTADAFSEPD